LQFPKKQEKVFAFSELPIGCWFVTRFNEEIKVKINHSQYYLCTDKPEEHFACDISKFTDVKPLGFPVIKDDKVEFEIPESLKPKKLTFEDVKIGEWFVWNGCLCSMNQHGFMLHTGDDAGRQLAVHNIDEEIDYIIGKADYDF